MKKILMAAMMGAGGLLVTAPNALAQECRIRPTRTPSYTNSRHYSSNYRPTYTTSRTVRPPYFRRVTLLPHPPPSPSACAPFRPVRSRRWNE